MATVPEHWWAALSRAVGAGAKLLHSAEEFDAATEHALSLLRDSSNLLGSGSHATAAFLAITAIEETVKIHIGSYRRNAEEVRRGRDPLYQHAEKHRLAAAPDH
jgi:AbiV family abortive infection protein